MSPKENAGDRRFDEAVDWLLNSGHCADPDIQDRFWGIVDGFITAEEINENREEVSLLRYRLKQCLDMSDESGAATIRQELSEWHGVIA